MSWEDAASAIEDTEEQLEKLTSHLKEYEHIHDKNSKIIKNAEDLAEGAEAPRHFTIAEVKRHLAKLEVSENDISSIRTVTYALSPLTVWMQLSHSESEGRPG